MYMQTYRIRVLINYCLEKLRVSIKDWFVFDMRDCEQHSRIVVNVKELETYIWTVLREKVPNFLSRCHTKRRTGAAIFEFFFWKVDVMPKEGRARPCMPVLLLVWQRLRTLGTFSCNAAQLPWVWNKERHCILQHVTLELNRKLPRPHISLFILTTSDARFRACLHSDSGSDSSTLEELYSASKYLLIPPSSSFFLGTIVPWELSINITHI